eukprot:gene23391-29604_t
MIRVHGDVRRINVEALDHKTVHAMVYDIMSDSQRKQYEEFLEVDFSFEIEGLARFRVNAFNQNRGAAAVFRTIPSKILTLALPARSCRLSTFCVTTSTCTSCPCRRCNVPASCAMAACPALGWVAMTAPRRPSYHAHTRCLFSRQPCGAVGFIAKGGNAAFGRHARSGEDDDAARLVQGGSEV